MIIEKRYSNKEVSEATGLSSSTVTAYASKIGMSTKQGWTLPQVWELVHSPRRVRESGTADPANVAQLRAGLLAWGWPPEGEQLDGQIAMEVPDDGESA